METYFSTEACLYSWKPSPTSVVAMCLPLCEEQASVCEIKWVIKVQREGVLLPPGTAESLGKCSSPAQLLSASKSNLTFHGIQKTNCTIGRLSRSFIAFLSGRSNYLLSAIQDCFRPPRNKLEKFTENSLKLRTSSTGTFIFQGQFKFWILLMQCAFIWWNIINIW